MLLSVDRCLRVVVRSVLFLVWCVCCLLFVWRLLIVDLVSVACCLLFVVGLLCLLFVPCVCCVLFVV